MHNLSSAYVLGYHGCDRKVGEKLLENEAFRPSENYFDWLGSGIYFWEANPSRAMEWAWQRSSRKKSKGVDFEPSVVGAVIDLGFCLDLMSSNGIRAVEEAYAGYAAVIAASGAMVPENIGGDDLLKRKLDCAVINYYHAYRKRDDKQPIDTVRAVFTEGDEIYPTAGFKHRTHVQICVRNPLNIHGVFRVNERYFTTGG